VGFLIFEVAGKHYSSAENDFANVCVMNELQVFDASNNPITLTMQSKTQSGGNFPYNGYWDNVFWDKSKLLDGNLGCSEDTATIIAGVQDAAAEINTFYRYAIKIDATIDSIAKILVWFGGNDMAKYRLPKQVSLYYCNSYTVSTHLTNRSNSGLTLLGTVDIPKTTQTITSFDLMNNTGKKFHTYIL